MAEDGEGEYDKAIVDIGSSAVKFGLSSQGDFVTEPLLTGGPAGIMKQVPGSSGLEDSYVGQKAADPKTRGLLNLTSPVVRGGCPTAEDFDGLSSILRDSVYAGSQGVKDGENTKFLLTVPTLCPWSHRIQLAKFHFEEYNTPALALFNQAVLSCRATGAYTGVFMDIGHGVTQTVPVFAGYAIPSAMRRTAFGGADLDSHMQRLLMQEGVSFTTTAEMQVVRGIKEEHAFVAADPEQEFATATAPANMTLPDGTSISLTKSRFLVAEPLFNPEIMGRQMPGLQGLITESAFACPMDVRLELMKNIYVSGGTSVMPGLCSRLQSEARKMCDVATVKNSDDENRKNNVWLGGLQMAQMYTEDSQTWITNAEWKDVGENIVFRKGTDRYFDTPASS